MAASSNIIFTSLSSASFVLLTLDVAGGVVLYTHTLIVLGILIFDVAATIVWIPSRLCVCNMFRRLQETLLGGPTATVWTIPRSATFSSSNLLPVIRSNT